MDNPVYKNSGFNITIHHYTTSDTFSVWIDGPDSYSIWKQGLDKGQAAEFIKEQTSMPKRTFLYLVSTPIVKKIMTKIYGTILIPQIPENIKSIDLKK